MNARPKQLRLKSAALFIVLAALLFGGAGITAVTARSAIPGDALYAVKTTLEQTRLSLAQDAGDRAQLKMGFAQRRLDEIAALIEEGRYRDISEAVLDFEADIHSAIVELETVSRADPARAARIALEITEALTRYAKTLSIMAASVPENVRPEVARALDTTQIAGGLDLPTGEEEPNGNQNTNDRAGEDNENDNANANDSDDEQNGNGIANGDDQNGIDGVENGNTNEALDDNRNTNDDDQGGSGSGNTNSDDQVGNGSGNTNDDRGGNGNGNTNDDDRGGNENDAPYDNGNSGGASGNSNDSPEGNTNSNFNDDSGNSNDDNGNGGDDGGSGGLSGNGNDNGNGDDDGNSSGDGGHGGNDNDDNGNGGDDGGSDNGNSDD
jgi:hypothetical protein